MDMSGAAAALEATAAIAELGLPINVLCVVPAVENMPGGGATRPGDVITQLNGKTVEVNNTDAEGRLILADALTWSAREGAERLVDLATLTGAVVVALGSSYAGLVATDDELAEAITGAGDDHRRARLAPADAPRVQRADARHVRRSEQRLAEAQGRTADRGGVPRASSSRTRRGPTWTSPAPPGTSAGPTSARDQAASASACSSSSRAGSPERSRNRLGPAGCDTSPPMDFDLTDEQRLLRDTVRDFARSEVAPVAEQLDREHAFPYELVAKMGELGLMGIPFPEEYGGGGADTLTYALAVEELTRIDSSVAITMAAHTSLGTMPIYLFGSEEQKRDWLPAADLGLEARRLRPDRARGRIGCRQRADPGVARRRRLDDRRRQAVHHQRRYRDLGLRVDHGRDRGRQRQQGDLEHHRPERDPRLRARRAVPEDGLERVRHPPAQLRGLPRPRGQPARPARQRLQAVPADPRRRPDRRRRDGRRPRPGRARRGARLREGAPGLRQADRQVPDDPGKARRLSPPRSRRRACSPTRRRCSRTAASRSRRRRRRRS